MPDRKQSLPLGSNRQIMNSMKLNFSFLRPSFFPPPDRFGGPKPGDAAPAFTLKSSDGQSFALADFIGKKPVVLEFGSFSCQNYRGETQSIQKLLQKYGNEVQFFMIYTLEAHPAGSKSPYANRSPVPPKNKKDGIFLKQPVTFEERISHAAACKTRLSVISTILIDEMDNRVWKAYGSAPNCAYVIGKDGKIVVRNAWADASSIEKTLRKLIGSR